MAIAVEETVLGGLGDGGGDSFLLTSWTPGANELVLVAVAQRDESIAISVAGNGLTFVEIANVDNTQSQCGIALFRAMGASPSVGQITVTVTGNTKPVSAVAMRFSGTDTSGTNGSGACEASATDAGPAIDDANMKVDITTLTNNAWAFACGTHRNKVFTVPGGETSISINNTQGTGGDITVCSCWYELVASAGLVTVGADGDLSGAIDWCIIAVSIKPAGATTTTTTTTTTSISGPPSSRPRYVAQPTVEIISHAGIQYTPDATGIKYSNHYSEEGSGFGYLTFTLQRRIGYNYEDIGFGYQVKLRKGIRNILFDGTITKIDEAHGDQGDQITINCVGWNSLLGFERLNFVLSDTRLNRWIGSETESGSFLPQKFDVNTSWNSTNGLQFKPRRSVDFEVDDYTYTRYTFEFEEVAARVTYDYDVALPGSWPGKLEVIDSAGTVLHSVSATESGTKDITISTGSYVEIRFYVTDAGENTAEDDTIYARLTNVLIYSTRDTVDTARVAKTIVDHMATNFGLSPDTYKLLPTGFTLPQAAFDTDQTPAEILEWCAKFGGSGYAPIAWGMELNDKRRMFVELQDTSTLKYIIPRQAALSATVSGDWGTSYQKVYTVIQDEAGQTTRSATSSDTDQMDNLGGMYRKEALLLGQITSAQATQAIAYGLSESAKPKTTSSFSVSSPIQTPSGAEVPIDEIKAGGMVEIPDLRAREATIVPDDLRHGFTTFMLIGVEIDLDSHTATLIPAGDTANFQRYMAALSQVAGL
jgi:hypothetical protein